MTAKDWFGSNYKGEAYGVGFDVNSIMNFPKATKDKEFWGIIKLKKKWKKKCKTQRYPCVFGQNLGLSMSDAYQVNKLFKCPTKPNSNRDCPIYDDGLAGLH